MAKGKGKSKGKGRAKPKKKTIASRADKHKLYQAAVQSPEADVEFFGKVFKDIRGRTAKSMREDFCGTAFLSCAWADSKKTRTAIGIDLDQPTLDWGRAHNLAKLPEASQSRVSMVQGNVLDGLGAPTDFTCALNFCYGVFKTRDELRELLLEAGFSGTKVYWERTDADGDGTGEYVPTEEEENQDSWLVYIVGIK
jgi:hypothetical protein